MTRAFLEPTVLKTENEKFIVNAFSKENLKKIKAFDEVKRKKLQRTSQRKLSLSDLFA